MQSSNTSGVQNSHSLSVSKCVDKLLLQASSADLLEGVNFTLTRNPAPPAPPAARRMLLQTDSQDGVNMTITITAPASDMSNITDLVQQVVNSDAVRRQLQEAGQALAVTC